MGRKPFVLCMAAWVGGGKTTVVEGLLKHLSNARAVYFDSYPMDFLKQDYYQWSMRGNDYNEWHFEPIAADLEVMLQEDIDFILLEFPMGRANKLIAQYIDLAVYLDVPMDVLLARRVIRDYCNRSPEKRKLDNPLQSLEGYLADYLTRLRVTVENYAEVVRPTADCIINGYQPVESIIAEILDRVEKETSVR